MGVDVGDYDRSGRQHLLVGNFSNQMLGLYHNEGNNLFVMRRHVPPSVVPVCSAWLSAYSLRLRSRWLA